MPALVEGPHENCGWDEGSEWYACGFNVDNQQVPIDCTESYVLGDACPDELTVVGCCDEFGNNYWCESQMVNGEQCGDTPIDN